MKWSIQKEISKGKLHGKFSFHVTETKRDLVQTTCTHVFSRIFAGMTTIIIIPLTI